MSLCFPKVDKHQIFNIINSSFLSQEIDFLSSFLKRILSKLTFFSTALQNRSIVCFEFTNIITQSWRNYFVSPQRYMSRFKPLSVNTRSITVETSASKFVGLL